MRSLILIFDLPREEKTLQMRVLRSLHKMNAKKLQHSVWKSNNLQGLLEIASFIKKSGGEARILEEKFIF